MIRNTLHNLSSVCVLSILLYVPAGVAAPITQFSFDATILETSGPSSLTVNDTVSGYIQIDSADQDGPPLY